LLDHKSTIEAFLAATAAKQPTPGGGSVTALAGAVSTSLAEMVLAYSIGRKEAVGSEAALKELLAEMTRARKLLLGLMAEDQAAYAALSASKRLPQDAPRRDELITGALTMCLRIPQAVATTALAVLELCDRAAPMANKNLLSDLAIAADLATATVRCAIYNVKVNLSEVRSAEERATIEDTSHKTLVRALSIIQRLSPNIWNRLGVGT
jgi:methenyltetrahydrofolate cyclohydrolase